MDKIKKRPLPSFRPSYDEEFKHEICRKYLSGQFSKTELQDKYGIKGKSRLLTWLRTLGYINKNVPFMKRSKAPKPTKAAIPTDQKSLEEALEDARLQAAMYLKMIEIAEREYKIKIRKNSDTK